MNRRGFLAGSATAAAVVTTGATSLPHAAPRQIDGYEAAFPPGTRRAAVDRDDAGYRLWACARGDGKKIVIYLDGVEQKWATLADELDGVVRRVVATPEGRMAVGQGELFTEEVRGSVEVRIV